MYIIFFSEKKSEFWDFVEKKISVKFFHKVKKIQQTKKLPI